MWVVLMMMMMMTEAVGREERFLLSVGRTRALAGRTLPSSLHHIARPATADNHQASQVSNIAITKKCQSNKYQQQL